MKFYTSLFVILLLMAILSWNTGTGEHPMTDTPSGYHMTGQSFIHPDCTIDEDPCVSLRFSYPVFRGGSSLADSVQLWVDSHIGQSTAGIRETSSRDEIQKLAEAWFDDYDRYREKIHDYAIPWSLDRFVELVYENRQLISLHFNEISFTGGAHPVQTDKFQSFDLTEGRLLTLSDLTNDREQYNQLVRLAEEQFRYTYELLEKDDLGSKGYRSIDGTFALPDNFAFTDYGLLFYFNNFEIAPFATRPIAIELPYDDLRFIIRTRWMNQEMMII